LNDTPLKCAADRGHLEVLGFYLESKVIINHKGWTEEETTHLIQSGGLFEYINFLMFFEKIQSDLFRKWKYLLMISLEKSKILCLRFLLSYGAKRNFHNLENIYLFQNYI